MRTNPFIKPDLSVYFAAMPIIGMWMEFDYDRANTFDDMARLCHKWLHEAEVSNNPVRQIHYQAAANFAYTLVTGRSFDSKHIELLIDELD